MCLIAVKLHKIANAGPWIEAVTPDRGRHERRRSMSG
jgi:hypothetical protein